MRQGVVAIDFDAEMPRPGFCRDGRVSRGNVLPDAGGALGAADVEPPP